MPEYPVFTIEIKNTQPVELLDLTGSLLSLADEYKRFVAAQPIPSAPEDIKLYIKDIHSGSIVTDLIAMAPAALPFVEHAKVIVTFAKYLKTGIEYLLGRDPAAQRPSLTKQNLNNLSTFLEPIAKDGASQMNCHTTINGDVNYIFNVNSVEANAIQNRAKKEMDSLKEPVVGIKEKVVLYWYQARNDPRSQVGDRAIIESIGPLPVKTIFHTDAIKAEMLYVTENPFRTAYIVDVQVDTINDKPVIYKVLHVHERFERPMDQDGN